MIAIAVVIVTNPYMFADWGTFTHDLDRQRKFAVRRRRCSASPSATAGSTTCAASAGRSGVVPGLLAVRRRRRCSLVKGRRREAIVLGSLVVLYWLYMGSQSRFYARWMLPLYPALAILAAYALTQIKQQRRRSRVAGRAAARPRR